MTEYEKCLQILIQMSDGTRGDAEALLVKAIKVHCKKSYFLFVKSTGEMLRVKSEMYFLV